METPEAQNIETVRALQLANAREQRKAAVFMAVALSVIFVLPGRLPLPLHGIAMGFGSAVAFTACVLLNPRAFRSRHGALTTAKCLEVIS